MINEAHTSIEPEDALTPDIHGKKTKRRVLFPFDIKFINNYSMSGDEMIDSQRGM